MVHLKAEGSWVTVTLPDKPEILATMEEHIRSWCLSYGSKRDQFKLKYIWKPTNISTIKKPYGLIRSIREEGERDV